MPRLPALTVIGVLLAMLIGTIIAFAEYVADNLRLGGLFPRDWDQP